MKKNRFIYILILLTLFPLYSMEEEELSVCPELEARNNIHIPLLMIIDQRGNESSKDKGIGVLT